MAGVQRVTLTGRLTRADGQSATGYVQVRVLNPELVPDDDGVILVPQPERIRLDDTGGFSTLVPVTDDPGNPRWIVVDLLPDDTPPDQLVFTVDGTADPVDLADVQPVPVVPDSDAHEVAVPWSLLGEPGGVAPLGPDGKIPAQFVLPSQGGTVAVLDDLEDVEGAAAAAPGVILRKGADGIYRPTAADTGMRGDAVFFRQGPPAPATGHQVSDVWVDTANSFAVYQVEEQ